MSKEKDEEIIDYLTKSKKIPFPKMIKRLFGYLKPVLGSFILAIVLLLINVAFDIISPLITSYFIGYLTGDTPELIKFFGLDTGIQISIIVLFAVTSLVIAVVNQGFLYAESLILQSAGQEIVFNLRVEVFSHIESLSQNQFNEMPVGSLVTRVGNYTSRLSDLFTNTLVNLVRNALTVIGVYGIMFFISPLLSLVLSIFVVIVFISSFIFSKYIHKMFKQEHDSYSAMDTFLSENLGGMRIIQIFNAQNKKHNEFNEKNEKIKQASYGVIKGFGFYRPFISLLYVLSIATTFYCGIQPSMMLTTATVVAFYQYISRFFNPIQNIADQINNLQRAFTSCEKLFALLDLPAEVLDIPTARDVDHFEGKIEFRHVWFSYIPDEWILKDVSFVINPKETAAFVGATGAGKTTILSLIVRNFEIQKGEILIDDINIKDIKIDSLRKKIGQMLQDVFLFSGSIKTNITLHDDSFTDEQVVEACKYVNADKFINILPNKYEEMVTERGENFSNGQRQLLSFARTVIHQPQILILDEATANIDTETEVLIQESLEKMKSIGTMLVVAHRLSTIQKADQIFVLNNGVIVEHGNHQQLLKQKGQYYKLYQLQFEND